MLRYVKRYNGFVALEYMLRVTKSINFEEDKGGGWQMEESEIYKAWKLEVGTESLLGYGSLIGPADQEGGAKLEECIAGIYSWWPRR